MLLVLCAKAAVDRFAFGECVFYVVWHTGKYRFVRDLCGGNDSDVAGGAGAAKTGAGTGEDVGDRECDRAACCSACPL